MVIATVIVVVAEDDVVEGDMVKTHIHLPAGTEHLWQKLVYNLQTNVGYSPRNKMLILKKYKFMRDGEALKFPHQVNN